MRKISAFFLAFLLAVSCIACGSYGLNARTEAGSDSSERASSAEKRDSEEMDLAVFESTAAPEKEKSSETASETTEEPTDETETSEEPPEAEPKTIRTAVTGLPAGMDPVSAVSPDEKSVFSELYVGLYFWDMNYKGEAELRLGIAADWPEFSDDGLTARIRLKQTVWSDGSPLTAYDFADSFLAARESLLGTERYETFSFFQTRIGTPFVDAPDESTLVIRLKRPCLFLADILSQTVFLPVRSEEADETAGGEPVSNGPFVLKEAGERSWVLVKNPLYFQAEKVSYDELCFDLITGTGTQFLAYKAGQADVISQIPESVRSRYAEDAALCTQRLFGVRALQFSAEAEIFAGKTPEQASAMREAFHLLIDRQILKDDVWGEKTRLAETLIAPGVSDGNGGILEENRSFFDAKSTGREKVEEAKKLLETAGFSFTDIGNGFSRIEPALQLTVSVPDDPDDRKTVQSIAEDLSFLGIEVEAEAAGEKAAASLVSIRAEQDDAFTVLAQVAADAVSGENGTANERLGKMEVCLQEAQVMTDPDRRALALKDAEDFLFDTWLVLPLYCETDAYLLASSLSGVYETPFGVRRYLYAVKE